MPPVGWWFKYVGVRLGKSGRFNSEVRIRGPGPKIVILCFQEKLRMETVIKSYRKPTQVDEERILRRMGEL